MNIERREGIGSVPPPRRRRRWSLLLVTPGSRGGGIGKRHLGLLIRMLVMRWWRFGHVGRKPAERVRTSGGERRNGWLLLSFKLGSPMTTLMNGEPPLFSHLPTLPHCLFFLYYYSALGFLRYTKLSSFPGFPPNQWVNLSWVVSAMIWALIQTQTRPLLFPRIGLDSLDWAFPVKWMSFVEQVFNLEQTSKSP